MLEIKNSIYQIKNTVATITCRLDQTGERIFGIEEKVMENYI
jgi:hypothetical protein